MKKKGTRMQINKDTAVSIKFIYKGSYTILGIVLGLDNS